MKKYLAIASFAVLLITVPVAVYLVYQRQEIRKEAAVPGGTATFSLSGPPTVTVGQTLPVTIKVLGDTSDDRGIIGIKATLKYSFTGDNSLRLTKEDIEEKLPDPWSYYLKQVSTEENSVTIVVEAVYLQAGETGYTESETEPQPFATLNFTTLRPDTVTLAFVDAERSEVRAKEQNLDVLNIDLARATYTITSAEGEPPPSPTATSIPPAKTPTPTASPGAGGQTPTHTPTPPALPTNTPAVSGQQVSLTSVSEGQTVTDTTPTFSGTAAPGANITIVVQSEPITGNTTADSSGYWSWTPSQEIPPGTHTVTIIATDSQGNRATTTTNFTVAAAAGGGELSPTPTPTVPVTGSITPVAALALSGLVLLIVGAVF